MLPSIPTQGSMVYKKVVPNSQRPVCKLRLEFKHHFFIDDDTRQFKAPPTSVLLNIGRPKSE